MNGTTPRRGLLDAVRVDLHRLHRGWLSLVYPRQLGVEGTVLGRWTPSTTRERVGFTLWSALGVAAVLVGYPLLLAGFAVRFYAGRLDGAATRLGLTGVVVLAMVVWGALTLLARVQLSTGGFLAVLLASMVASLSAGLAFLFSRVGGRGTSVVLGYPFAVTALFLPPVVAALYSPTIAAVVFPNSQTIAVWLLDNVLTVVGVADRLRSAFDLTGLAYVGMWFGLAVPMGWLLGLVVTLANVVRPH